MSTFKADPTKTFAVVVGVERYGIPGADINGPVRDACRFVRWLQGRAVPAGNIHLFASPLEANAAELMKLAVPWQPAGREPLHRCFTQTLPGVAGDLLLLFWGGHGLLTGVERRLIYADATDVATLNLNLDSLLMSLHGDLFAGFPHQVAIVDACANFVRHLRAPELFPYERYEAGTEQFVLYGARLGEVAKNDGFLRAGIFSSAVMDELERQSTETFPPDISALAKQLISRFEELRAAGRTDQTPVVFRTQDWGGSTEQFGQIPLSIPEKGGMPTKLGITTAAPLGRLFQLPAQLTDFVGREKEVSELVGRLRSVGGPVGLWALKGMGGIGKTTLAVRVAHEVKDQFPDAQLFLDLRGVALQGLEQQPVKASEAMARFIRDFHPEIPELPESETELLPIYRSTLSGKRALIVLDNAADESQVKNLIAGDRTGFIITSRRALTLDGVIPVQVDILSVEKSLELLRNVVASKGTDEELLAVAKLSGYLPLALRVAGDFLRLKDGWTVRQYIDVLNQERHRWLKIGRDPQKDVEAVLKLSTAQLVRDEVDLATRWHFLADWPSDFAADAAAAAWDMATDEHTVREDLSKLVERSLLLFDEKSFRYRLHDLMKPIAAGLFT